MSICFDSSGILSLKKETKNEFAKNFKEIADKYHDNDMSFMCNDNGLLQYIIYARHYFMSEIIEFIKNNINMVEEGRLEFRCDDEDGSIENPFPSLIIVEVVDGQVFEETINTRLPCDWEYYVSDNEWFRNEYKKRYEKSKEPISIIDNKEDEKNKKCK